MTSMKKLPKKKFLLGRKENNIKNAIFQNGAVKGKNNYALVVKNIVAANMVVIVQDVVI